MAISRYSSQPGLVGLFVHVLRDGRIEEQGQIVRADRSFGYVQLYSWLSGETMHIKVYSLKFLRSENCRLYETAEDWNHAYMLEERKHGD